MDKEAQIKKIGQYNKEHYEEIKIRVLKGKKQQIKQHAEKQGESVNSFINRAIEHQIEDDDWK